MVFLLLKIKAELENLTNLVPQGPNFTFFFKVQCGSCGTMSEKHSGVSAADVVEIPNSRGTANLVQKCKLCKKTGTISLVDGKNKPYTLEDSESGKFVPVMCFDCRGMEPVEFSCNSSSLWEAEGLNSGTRFSNIDLSDGEFVEYDEKAAESVGIYKLEHRFETTSNR
ncbi:hypothetical protein SELMODRAFT_146445 [Selaginella moellendorffii]|uniref:Uncharacterized protein n=1 Tax=Selaginella moellendorffii TaxID=88036 RepID=D8REI2_SELML|nr:UPF0587 protein C1orf123 [Selaginella moellendorffii]EFJ29662.1 hypothetical protein SELMODRAFT_146445 [Selaginella moellendorffii]|eukprot:XP_002969574.1 UPF0587 protein C1orf123 [Selaginella moellendorffii]